MGHSGPPTGDFQLEVNPRHDTDDSDDEDEETLPPRSVPFWSYG